MAKKYLDYDGLKTFWRIIKGRFNFLGSTGITIQDRNIKLNPASNSEIGGIKTKGGFIKYSGYTEDDEILESTVSTIGETPQNFVDVYGTTSEFITENTAIVTIPITPTPSTEGTYNKVLATRYYVDHKVGDLNKTMVHRIKLVDELPTEITEEEDLLNTYIIAGYKEEDLFNSDGFDHYNELYLTDLSEYNGNTSRPLSETKYIYKVGDTIYGPNTYWYSKKVSTNAYILNSKTYTLLPEDTIEFITNTNIFSSVDSSDYPQGITKFIYSVKTETNSGNITYSNKILKYGNQKNDNDESYNLSWTNKGNDTEHVKIGFYLPIPDGSTVSYSDSRLTGGKITVKHESPSDKNYYEEYIFVPKYDDDGNELVKDGDVIQGKFEKIGSSKDMFTLSTITDSEINSITSDNNQNE